VKYLKTYKLFENQENINSDIFKELFTEIKDEGFNLKVKESSTIKIDFSKSPIINSGEIRIGDEQIKTIDVIIDKNIRKGFLIDDIKENLLFVESYAKHELGLELNYIYVSKTSNYTYYKSVEYLPFDSNWWIDSITFAFTKI